MASGETPWVAETDLFLSYNRQDQEAVLAIRQRLELRGIRTFLDRDQLVAGLPWPQALEKGLKSARAVAVFLGPHDFGLWQKREMFFALDLQVQAERERRRRFPVIPVLLKDAQPKPGFLFLNTWADFRNTADEAEALETLIRAIKWDERGTARAVASVCPYLGLRPFREEDQAFYFGRDAIIGLLVEKIRHQPIVAVVGPSGSGKSSVVLAGVLPRLRRQRLPLPTWDAISFTPGENPWWRLAHALVPLLEPDLSETRRIEQAGVLSKALLGRNGALAGTFARVIERSSGTDRLLLVVDQFEEMFTLVSGEEDLNDEKARKETAERKQKCAWFLEDLLISTKSTPVTIVLTLRADYYGHALNASRELCDALNTGQVALGPMLPDELRQAVTGPAGRVGLEFEPGLVNRILKEVGEEPGSLPLLEYALTQLWDRRLGGMLTSAAYDAFGGVAGAIGDKADGVYNTFSETDKNVCRALLGRLLHVSPADSEGADTRQRATRQEIGEAGWRIALKLAVPDVRLLVIARDMYIDQETAEVAHEALIRSWKRLRDWLREDRIFLLWRQQLDVFLSIWENSSANGEEAILRGPALDEALKWRKSKDSDLNARERKFIVASNDAREQFGRRRLWTRRLAATLAILMLMAGLAWFGYAETDRYQIDRILADAPWKTLTEGYDYYGQGRSAVLLYLRAVAYSRPDEALRTAQKIQFPSYLGDPLSSIAEAQAAAGQFADALRTAQKIHGYQGAALRSIAEAQAAAGQFGEALRTAQKIQGFQSTELSGRVLRSIAEAQAAAGQFAHAMRTAQEIQDPSSQGTALISIAQAEAAAGQSTEAARNWEAALRTAQEIQDPSSQAAALSSIARTQATAGQPAEASKNWEAALRTAQKIQDPSSQADALVSIAQALATAGRFADALRTAQKIQGPEHQATTLSSIAQALATAGQFAEAATNWEAALLKAEEIQDQERRADALVSIARTQATAGQPAEALRTAQKIQDLRQQAYALVSIAQAEAAAGRSTEAAKNWEGALRTAQKLENTDHSEVSSSIRSSIAKAQAIAGRFADALRTAQKIQDESIRSSALSSIATAQAKAHQWKAARNMAAPCEARDRLEVYTIILTEYAKANNLKLEQRLKNTTGPGVFME
jgi:tetratricopeptide (TPR) repeat protein/energy-coupling factor transporter ATP-binding protein EcfA2